MKLIRVLLLSIVLGAITLFTGCPEAEQMVGPVVDTTEPPTTVGEVKDDLNEPGTPATEPVATEPDEPTEPTPPADTTPPTVVELTAPITYHYINGIAVADIIPSSAWALNLTPPLQEYPVPEHNPDDFVGRVYIPMTDPAWQEASDIAPVPNAVVTITDGPRAGEQVRTDEGGYYLFPDVAGDALYLRVEREYLEPKEVIVHRSRYTTFQESNPNRVFDPSYHANDTQPQNIPGTILVGLRWPDAVRSILEKELLPHDPLLTTRLRLPDEMAMAVGGLYDPTNLLIIEVNLPDKEGMLSYSSLSHELAHARQHAVAIANGGSTIFDWENTPEAKAYAKAWNKDLEEIDFGDWLGTLDKSDYYESNILENAAEFCHYYWGTAWAWNYEITRRGGIQARCPNRYKWAQEWLKLKK